MITADDQLNWYFDQLSGLEPETTPGRPYAGFYLLRRRTVRPNDDPNRKPGDSRNKVTVRHLPVAIWWDEGWDDWCVSIENITHIGADYADEVFSRCCRAAISKDEYERLRNEDF